MYKNSLFYSDWYFSNLFRRFWKGKEHILFLPLLIYLQWICNFPMLKKTGILLKKLVFLIVLVEYIKINLETYWFSLKKKKLANPLISCNQIILASFIYLQIVEQLSLKMFRTSTYIPDMMNWFKTTRFAFIIYIYFYSYTIIFCISHLLDMIRYISSIAFCILF